MDAAIVTRVNLHLIVRDSTQPPKPCRNSEFGGSPACDPGRALHQMTPVTIGPVAGYDSGPQDR